MIEGNRLIDSGTQARVPLSQDHSRKIQNRRRGHLHPANAKNAFAGHWVIGFIGRSDRRDRRNLTTKREAHETWKANQWSVVESAMNGRLLTFREREQKRGHRALTFLR